MGGSHFGVPCSFLRWGTHLHAPADRLLHEPGRQLLQGLAPELCSELGPSQGGVLREQKRAPRNQKQRSCKRCDVVCIFSYVKKKKKKLPQQGSFNCSPCKWWFPFMLGEKSHVSNGCKLYLSRSPVQIVTTFPNPTLEIPAGRSCVVNSLVFPRRRGRTKSDNYAS